MSDEAVNLGRRHLLTFLTSVAGGIGVVAVAVPFLASLKPSARAQALGAPIEVDVSKIEPGQRITVEWRGKPIYIVRRTPEALAANANAAAINRFMTSAPAHIDRGP